MVHPLGDEADPKYHEFSFDVSYGGKSEKLTLHHGESKLINDIPIGTEVTVTQTDLPEGFCSDRKENKYTLCIDEAGIYLADFTNTYSPKSVTLSNVALTGDIELTGRELIDSDKFIYKLRKYDGIGWTDMGEVTASGAETAFDLTEFISAESFNASGVYVYAVAPVIPENTHNGITYDKVVRWFEVIVGDNNWDGSYEISSIVGFNGGIVAKNNNKWSLHTSFFSEYKASGNDAVSIVVDTLIDGNPEYPLDGYLYGLYQNGVLIQAFPASDINGESVVTLSYSALDIGNSIDYTVKQILPDIPASDIAYSDKEYKVTVKVEDDLMGNVKASITAGGKTDREAKLTFVNTYMSKASDKDSITSDKPSNNTTTAKQDKDTKPVSQNSTSPMTGDNGIIFWGIMLLASFAVIVIIICTKKRKTVN